METRTSSGLFTSNRTHLILASILVLGLIAVLAARTVTAETQNQPVKVCYDNNSRIMRFVDSEVCRNTESSLTLPSMTDFVKLQDALTQETADRQAADTAEAQARAAADTALETSVKGIQASITTEIADRKAGDAALQKKLDDEIAARQSALGLLETALNDEIAARGAAESSLQTDIGSLFDGLDQERLDRIAAVLGEEEHRATAVNEARDEANTRVQTLFDGIRLIITDIMRFDLPQAVTDLKALIHEYFTGGIADDMASKVQNMMGNVIEAAQNAIANVAQDLQDNIQGVLAAIQAIWDWLFGWFGGNSFTVPSPGQSPS
jgi:hypothetical protein